MKHICQAKKRESWKKLFSDLLSSKWSYSIKEIERKYKIDYKSIMRNKQYFHFKNEKNKYKIGRDRKKVYLKNGYIELLRNYNKRNCFYLLKLFWE